MKSNIKISELKNIFSKYTEIKLAYLFGSQAKGRVSILSDYDFAIYVPQTVSATRKKDILLKLIAALSQALKTDNIDLIFLDKDVSPLLKFMVIKDGVLLYEKEPYKLLVEPMILNEYFDFDLSLKKYNL